MRILQDVSVDGSLTGTSFIKTGGTSAQFLMADGSVTTGGGGNQTIGTDTDITYSGATVVSSIALTDGVVVSHSSRTLTLANLGYTGATNANYITNNSQLTNGANYITSAGNTQLSTEEVQDIVGAMFVDGTNTTAVYSDASNTMSIDATGGSSLWTADTNGITYANNVGIGGASSSQSDLYVNGSANITGLFKVDGQLKLTMGVNLDGNAYIYDGAGLAGSTNQVLARNASGGVTWTTPSSGGSGTVTNVTGGTGVDVTNGTTTPNVFLDLDELTSAYTTTGMQNTDKVAIVDGTFSRKVSVKDFRRLDTSLSLNTASGTIIRMTASGTVTAGYAVCVSGGSESVAHANANSTPTAPAIGIAVNGASNGAGVDVLIHGIAYYTVYPTLTVGSQVFLDDLAGLMSNTAPLGTGDMVQVMGICIANDKILINPSSDIMIRS